MGRRVGRHSHSFLLHQKESSSLALQETTDVQCQGCMRTQPVLSCCSSSGAQ